MTSRDHLCERLGPNGCPQCGAGSGEPCEFRAGIYRHYKGGTYTAIALVTHHETRQPMVIYMSHTTGTFTVRPLRKMHEVVVGGKSHFIDCDAWLDWVEHDGKVVRRFSYVGPEADQSILGDGDAG